MSLDPRERKSWAGFLDLLQPPPGYRLTAALGTSFGLSIEALTAALLALCNADGESMAADPVAAVMAATRLRSRVRVIVHPGTISGSTHAASGRFTALLDRLILQAAPGSGLFHPKVWALQFEWCDPSRDPQLPIGRIVVGSRNLATSTSFEMGVCFEGSPDAAAPATSFSSDVAAALQEWLSTATGSVPAAIAGVPRFVRQLQLTDTPREAAEGLRLRWQGGSRRRLLERLPAGGDAALLVSPFVQAPFLKSLMARVERLHVLSTPSALDALDDETFGEIEQLSARQRSPVLYQVTDIGDPDGTFIRDVHAKLLMLEGTGGSVTYVGSANGTPPGWGLTSQANVEAMVEMRPGIGIERFIAAFIRQDKTRVHPWIAEYDRSARVDHADSEAERRLLAALRHIGGINLEMRYDRRTQVLTVSRNGARPLGLDRLYADVAFDFVPLLLTDEARRPVAALDTSVCRFEGVALEQVTAFVDVRARLTNPPMAHSRLVLSVLSMSEAELDQRDTLIRDHVMATADPAAVLSALVRGLAYSTATAPVTSGRTVIGLAAVAGVIQPAGLETMLQSVAAMPDLLGEMRLLLGRVGGDAFERLCADIEAALDAVQAERRP